MGSYEGFIPQNAAPKGAERIGIYDADGVRVGEIPLGSLRPRAKGERLYSFGILSDTHIKEADNVHNKMVENVLDKLCGDDEIAFICILGDGINGTPRTDEVWWQAHKALIDQYDSKPVHHITGNHDCIRNVLYGPYRNDVLLRDENGNVVTDEEGKEKLDGDLLNDSGMIKKAEEFINEYGGCAKPYKFEYKGDVFIMLSLYRATSLYPIYLKDDIKAIYRMFEENRNKRCFVMTHYPPQDLEDYDLSEKELEGWLPLSLFQHYENSVVFHGHTHSPFSNQESKETANYKEDLGFRSVHTPMTSYDEGQKAEAYIVDVYENGIHLRGYDFLIEKSVPLGTFWLDTPLIEIEAGTYADENGTIIKNKEG